MGFSHGGEVIINTIAENFDSLDNQASKLANYLMSDEATIDTYDRI